MVDNGQQPLLLRAHHLLCLQGFKGSGYSPRFVAGMSRVARRLRLNPQTMVKVVVGVDEICENCPHKHQERCTKQDPEGVPVPGYSPDFACLADQRVLKWLEITEGVVQDWGSILYKVGSSVDGSVISILCGDCQWRDLPHCMEELNMLHQRVKSGEFQPDKK